MIYPREKAVCIRRMLNAKPPSRNLAVAGLAWPAVSCLSVLVKDAFYQGESILKTRRKRCAQFMLER